MLRAALKCENEQIFIDLLTYADLEALKNKKGSASTTAVSAANSKKRYIILTE